MRYNLLVFDWDGTLYDSAAFVVESVQNAARKIQVEPPSPENIRQMMGLSYEEALKRSMPHLSPMQQCELFRAYKECVQSPKMMEPRLFSGAKEVLRLLRAQNYQLAIATGKSRLGLERDLKQLGLHTLFSMTRSADETAAKPNPQMLLEIMESLSIPPEETLMIGDTEYDMQLASNAHIDALGVSYGAHASHQLSGPRVQGLIHDITELPTWLSGAI